MVKNKDSLKEQIHRNLLAIISLFVAITALTYNSWRQEVTEDNRNLRLASFELIMQLGKLQLIVDHAHYDHNKEMGNPITGWGRVALIEDLSAVLPAPLPEKSILLKQAWSDHWEGLGERDRHAEQITAAIQAMRKEVRDQLTMIR